MERTDNLNIKRFRQLVSPQEVKNNLPMSEKASHTVSSSRKIIQNILTNKDKRRLVITGPCSLHDRDATLEYARRLNKLQMELSEKVLLVMRLILKNPGLLWAGRGCCTTRIWTALMISKRVCVNQELFCWILRIWACCGNGIS